MSSTTPTLRPLSCWKTLLRRSRQHKAITRPLSTYHRSLPATTYDLPVPGAPPRAPRHIRVFPPPTSPSQTFKEPILAFTKSQLSVLDPTGARTSLFSKTNPEAVHVGDVLLVRLKTGDPFAGVCINIRRRGIDTGILLRNELTRVGVEMWYKIYSPNVEGIEVVQRKEKRARRARLTYLRKKKHDMGSVQGLVLQWQKSRGSMRAGGATRGSGDLKGGKRKKTKGQK